MCAAMLGYSASFVLLNQLSFYGNEDKSFHLN
jgi:hypothetical protein